MNLTLIAFSQTNKTGHEMIWDITQKFLQYDLYPLVACIQPTDFTTVEVEPYAKGVYFFRCPKYFGQVKIGMTDNTFKSRLHGNRATHGTGYMLSCIKCGGQYSVSNPVILESALIQYFRAEVANFRQVSDWIEAKSGGNDFKRNRANGVDWIEYFLELHLRIQLAKETISDCRKSSSNCVREENVISECESDLIDIQRICGIPTERLRPELSFVEFATDLYKQEPESVVKRLKKEERNFRQKMLGTYDKWSIRAQGYMALDPCVERMGILESIISARENRVS